jgi:hypothetical protein
MEDRRWRLAPVLLGLLLVCVLPVAALAQGTGILEGQVANGTAGAPEPGAGLPVTLRIYQGDTEVDTLETTTGAGGSFRFEGLDIDGDLEYLPEVVYLDVLYRSAEPYRFDGDGTPLATTITVYETTDDDSAIALDSVHFIAESFGEVLRLSEIHLYGNSGDRTYFGQPSEDGELGTLYSPLPENAVGVAFEQDEPAGRYREVEGGIMDTAPVPPGQETSLAFFSYHLVVMADTIPLERSFAYPLTHLNLLVAQPGLVLNSDQLLPRGPQSFQGRMYDLYTVDELPAGASLAMEFVLVEVPANGQGEQIAPVSEDQTVAATSTRGNQELLRWLGFGLVVIVVTGAIVYGATRPSLPTSVTSAPALSADPEARRMLVKLADLEDAFEAGQVDEATYESQRAELHEAIKSLQS